MKCIMCDKCGAIIEDLKDVRVLIVARPQKERKKVADDRYLHGRTVVDNEIDRFEVCQDCLDTIYEMFNKEE